MLRVIPLSVRATGLRIVIPEFTSRPSLAYTEEDDGLLLSAAFLAAIILIGIGSAAVWGTVVGAVLISA